jgi:predicted SAM-dependent methyltransferase
LTTILRFPASDPAIRTVIGERVASSIRLRSGIGCGLFGPYVDLPAGRCIARITFEGPSEGRVTMDMSAEVGKIVLASRVVDLGALGGHTVELPAVLPRPLSACEVRLYCEPEVRADITAVEIELDQEGLTRFRKLNFGCGYDKREDYLNIDMDPACIPDLLIQDNDFSVVPKNHFEEILAWDVLEHIPRSKTLSALLDWAEFLRMDGKLILQTSSILGVARLLDRTNSYADHHNYTIYLYGNQAHAGDFHLTGFTETTLRVHLEAAGFETGVITTRDHWLFFTEARKTYNWTELATCAYLDTAQFIGEAYKAALYRAPDEGGREFLTRMLHEEGWSRRDALRHLFQAPERLFSTARRKGL